MSGQRAAVGLTREDSTQKFRVGTEHVDERGNKYRYMLASEALTAYLIYTYDHDVWTTSDELKTSIVASGEIHPLVCPQIAVTASYYFWGFVGPGRATFTSVAAITAQAKIYTSGTDGLIDDDSSGEFFIPGLIAYDAFASAVTGVCYAAHEMYVYNA